MNFPSCSDTFFYLLLDYALYNCLQSINLLAGTQSPFEALVKLVPPQIFFKRMLNDQDNFFYYNGALILRLQYRTVPISYKIFLGSLESSVYLWVLYFKDPQSIRAT